MREMLKKTNLTKKELEELDNYFLNGKIYELDFVDNEIIIRFIENCEKILGYSLCKIELREHLSSKALIIKDLFLEKNLDSYNKIIELIDYFSFYDWGLKYSIGDYLQREGKKEKAIEYYKKAFKKGFDLCDENYYDSLERYLTLLNKNPSEELKELIANTPKDGKYSLDFINTYLLLIVNLEKFSDEYLYYINEGIKVAKIVVKELQKYTRNRNSFSDTDEERDLCELITLKMEYYVEKKDYIKAFDLYKSLTDEIGKSDCTRYYHARDRYYLQMLKYMSEDYPELKFFDDIGYYEFKVISEEKTFKINQEIILQKENGMTFKFKITNIYEKEDITIVPLLPLIGEGGKIFTCLNEKDDGLYLKNVLSH